MPPLDEMVEALEQQGYSLGRHQSRLLTTRVLEKSDLVLCMSRRHVGMIQEQWPAFDKKVHLFAEYAAGLNEDVDDPAGGRRSDYDRCVLRLEALIERLLLRLRS
jgi:protein-tyrosine-phosphatase